MSKEDIENIAKSDSDLEPTFLDHQVLPDINFNGFFLIHSNISIPKDCYIFIFLTD